MKAGVWFSRLRRFVNGDPYWIRTSDLLPVKEAL